MNFRKVMYEYNDGTETHTGTPAEIGKKLKRKEGYILMRSHRLGVSHRKVIARKPSTGEFYSGSLESVARDINGSMSYLKQLLIENKKQLKGYDIQATEIWIDDYADARVEESLYARKERRKAPPEGIRKVEKKTFKPVVMSEYWNTMFERMFAKW